MQIVQIIVRIVKNSFLNGRRLKRGRRNPLDLGRNELPRDMIIRDLFRLESFEFGQFPSRDLCSYRTSALGITMFTDNQAFACQVPQTGRHCASELWTDSLFFYCCQNPI